MGKLGEIKRFIDNCYRCPFIAVGYKSHCTLGNVVSVKPFSVPARCPLRKRSVEFIIKDEDDKN